MHTLEQVAITSREDAIGLKLLNLRTSALALNAVGLVREVSTLPHHTQRTRPPQNPTYTQHPPTLSNYTH